ncbi:anti-sigma F factor [Desulforamulus aquiferis]|uniref:Anti-sigma F factor n=1 Tax=Desulforamulus aquiferis TaxID=1397668 RepID=A0AAW7Z9X4_9FIRM|nr:anti-sigma F factor [Desulforamulus aquiferis]MDO7786439.1 anti-sigma F factor [Desulforamulus aquiferis]RYD02551.1 ATPase [Desulforamulus aquiferis]
MKAVNCCSIEFHSIAENVSFARVAVAAFASQLDCTLPELEEIKVAVSEAVGNAIIHGYRKQTDKTVRLTVKIYKEGLEIIVEDSGQGIDDIDLAMQPAYSTDPERMGLGFVFMQSFSDRLRVESTPGLGTTVTMFKHIGIRGAKARAN